jgi:hypothetical protein
LERDDEEDEVFGQRLGPAEFENLFSHASVKGGSNISVVREEGGC